MPELLQNPLLWMALCAAGIPFFFWLGLRRLKVARTITDTPTSRVRSAAQGYVEVGGVARVFEGKANPAPLTRLPSVWWYYKIEEDQSSNDKKGWRTLKSGTSDDNFLLHDDTGYCVVDPEGAEVFPAIRKVWYGSQDWPAPELGTSNPLSGALHRYRYTEHRIPQEYTVNVIGEFRTLGRVGADLTEEVADLLRRWKTDQSELLRRFDANRDGVISADEWERARQSARDHVLHELATASSSQPALNMLSKPGNGRPFLIAGVDLDKIARNARLQALAAEACCVALVGLLAWLMTHR